MELTTWKEDALRLAFLEEDFGFEPIEQNSKKPLGIWAYRSKGLTLEKCFKWRNCFALGIRTGLELLCIDFDGEDSLDYAATNNINFTADSWHVRRDDNLWRFKVFYKPSIEQINQLPNGEFSKIKAFDQDIDVFLTSKKYLICIGNHEDGGNYIWPKGLGPEELAAPPDATWKWVLKVANDQPKLSTHRKSQSCNGDWIACRPCLICGRNKDDDCRINRSGDVVLCHQGNTHQPPLLKKGETVHRSGSKWAFCGTGKDAIGMFSTFKIHRPSIVQELNKQLAQRHHVF